VEDFKGILAKFKASISTALIKLTDKWICVCQLEIVSVTIVKHLLKLPINESWTNLLKTVTLKVIMLSEEGANNV
jgi:hypothetical protein